MLKASNYDMKMKLEGHKIHCGISPKSNFKSLKTNTVVVLYLQKSEQILHLAEQLKIYDCFTTLWWNRRKSFFV